MVLVEDLDARIDAQAVALQQIRETLDTLKLAVTQDPLPPLGGVYIPLRTLNLGG
jgi:hypothetical protein